MSPISKSKRTLTKSNILLAIIIFAGLAVFSHFRKSSQDAITFCTVTEFKSRKIGYSRLTYQYEVNGKLYEYSKRKERRDWIRQGESYVLTYKISNPRVHNPIFSIKFKSYAQLDSLTNKVGINNLGSMWNANLNNARLIQTNY